MAANVQDQTAQIRAALVRLGLSDVAAAEFTDNGITNMHRWRALTEDALDRLIKQLSRDNNGGAGLVIPFISQQYLHAVHFWTNSMYILGRPYDVALVTGPLAEAWNETRKEEDEAAEAPNDLIKEPKMFKKDTKWRPWRESVITYLHSKIGQASIPLAYIVCDHDIAAPDAIYHSTHEQLVNHAIHFGLEYHTNNGMVYDLLQSLTLNGPAWPWISGFQRPRDGKGAGKALIAYYEGDAMQMQSKQQCYDAIAKATYQGARRNFDFSSYVAIHQQAHQDLDRLGEPIPENKKVRDFLDGIMDPQCNSIKLNVLSSPVFMNNFAQTINYVASAINMILTNIPSSRQISEINTERSSGRGRGRGGRGGQNGRGRGGRGRRRNNNSDQSTATTAGSDTRPLTRGYSREEWQNLSRSEKHKIYRARERLETARTVAAMLREDSNNRGQNDDISTITGTVPQRIQADSSGSGQNNGHQSAIAGVTRSINQVSLDTASQAFNHRRLNAYTSGERIVMNRREIASISQSTDILHCKAELDSHADTCRVNHVARVLEVHGQVAQVSGFSDNVTPMKDITIVNAAVAYDVPETGEVVILVINQALYFGNSLSHILLNPNQMRINNLTIDDVPRHLSKISTHSIIVHDEKLTIPLQLNGIIYYFNVRTPTIKEVENCAHIVLTSTEEWNPYSQHFITQEQEASDTLRISAMNTEFMKKQIDGLRK